MNIHFDIVTIFPDAFGYLHQSIVSRAMKSGQVTISIHDLRKWTTDKHKSVDDKPFGGGPGMLMKIEPIYKCLKDLGAYPKNNDTLVVLTSAKGKQWDQANAQEYSQKFKRVVILCGHYEGFDHRITEFLADEEISIGNYVLSGGELPAMVIIDSITRLIPGVLGNEDSLAEETFTGDSSEPEYPQYTRPAIFTTDEGAEWVVPEILLSGHHDNIKNWRKNSRSNSQ